MGKRVKRFALGMLVFIALLLAISLSLRNSWVQTGLVNNYFHRIEKKFDGRLTVEKVLLRWPRRIELTNLLVLDQINDTLAFLPSLKASVRKFNFDVNLLDINRIILEMPEIHLKELPSGKMNYELLLAVFKSHDTSSTGKPFYLECNQFLIRQGSFSFRTYGHMDMPGKIDPGNINLSEIELNIRHIELGGNENRASIEVASLKESNGFKVVSLAGVFTAGTSGIAAEKLELMTGNSRISSNKTEIDQLWGKNRDTTGPFIDASIDPGTYIGAADIDMITGYGIEFSAPLYLSGHFKGTPVKASLMNTLINWGSLISYDGDLAYEFREKMKNTYFSLTTRDMIIDPDGIIVHVLSGQIPQAVVTLPESFPEIGILEYKGDFTGTIENFTTTGQWLLQSGSFNTDLTVVRSNRPKGYQFKGSFSAGEFNPDDWVVNPTGLSDMDFKVDVDGFWDGNKSVNAMLNGNISRFTLNNYQFRDLSLSGEATEQKFDGEVSLRDPNINLDLAGHFNFGAEIPEYDFDLSVNQADLYDLNIDRKDSVSILDLNVTGSLSGRKVDELNGQIRISSTEYRNSRGTLPVNNLVISSLPELGRRKLSVTSEYMDARLIGMIHVEDLRSQLISLAHRYVPSLSSLQAVRPEHLNDFSFNIQVKNSAPVTRVLFPGFQCKDNTRVSGSYSAADQTIALEGISPQFVIGGIQFTGLDFRAESVDDSLLISSDLAKVQLDRNNVFEKLRFRSGISGNHLAAGLDWKNSGKILNMGNIRCEADFLTDDQGTLNSDIRFPASKIVYMDSVWDINPFSLTVSSRKLNVDHLRIIHKSESAEMHGTVSNDPADTLYVNFNTLNLNHINQFTQTDDFIFKGSLTGYAKLFNLGNKGMFLADLEVDSLFLNGEPLGYTTISSRSSGARQPVYLNVLTRRGSIETLRLDGKFSTQSDSLDLNITLDKLRMNLLNPFISPDLRDIRGLASGKIEVSGKRSEPELSGNLLMQKASFLVDYLNTRYYFTHSMEISPVAFWVDKMDVQDEEGNHAIVTGGVRHKNLKSLFFDFNLDFKDFILLNAGELKNDGYWGRAYATGKGAIRGSLKNLVFDITAKTSKKTRFYVPVTLPGEAREIDFITYVQRSPEDQEADLVDFSVQKPKGYEVDLYGVTVDIDLEATPDAEVQLIIDSKVGDVIRGRGAGNLRIHDGPSSSLTMLGDITIEEGDYQFTLQNMPVKKFDINPGGTIKWTGDVSNAQLDIDAVYRTKAALYDLLQDESNSDLTQRIPVECHMMMNGYLENPSFKFNIVLPPTSNDIARSQLSSLTEEEMNKQIISLLILNRFIPLQGFGSGTSRGYENAGIATTTEVLSNQLNYWLSQINNDFDLGFNYRPGDELTSDEVEVALSTQIFNNRMSINVNGNYDIRKTNANASQLVGDVEVEYKIKPSGKLRVKAFTRANDHLLYEYAPYTQGLGMFYREEFDTFGELIRRYWDKWFRHPDTGAE